MITLSAVLLARSLHEQYFDAFRHKVIAFVCISSKISLINFKCVYNRSHLSSPQLSVYLQGGTPLKRLDSLLGGKKSPR
jgi:hypothetical protein